MSLQLEDIVPDLTADTTDGPINLHKWMNGSWPVLFSHPKDFTPVSTADLSAVAGFNPEFVRRDVKVIGLSVDPLEDNYVWVGDIAETQGYALHFPMIADADRQIAELYGIIHPNADDTLTVRSVFIISTNKTLRPLAIRAPAKRELQARNGLENF